MLALIPRLLFDGAVFAFSYVLFFQSVSNLIVSGAAVFGVNFDERSASNSTAVHGGNAMDRPPEPDTLPANDTPAVDIDEPADEASTSA